MTAVEAEQEKINRGATVIYNGRDSMVSGMNQRMRYAA